MARVIALLRGVNVGGRTLSMAALRDALADSGCTDVTTYIQSGNVVLTPPSGAPRALRPWLETIVAEVAGYEVPVVLRTRAQLERVVARNPYPEVPTKQLHVVFFSAAPPRRLLADADVDSFAPEHATLVGSDLYLHLPNGMGRARLPLALEKAGGRLEPPVLGTARNWNTLRALVELTG